MDADIASHKKHKKHKKHKHKRKHQPDEESDGEINVTDDVDLPKPAIKLKIKFGGQTVETKNSWGSGTGSTVDWNDQFLFGADEAITNIPVEESDSLSLWSTDELKLDAAGAADDSSDKTDTKKEANVDTSDEEREWLDALEAGKLDDNGDVIKKKDPSLLTARQRALLHGDQNDELLQLPSGYKAPELTEEQLQRRLQRAKKRREQAHQKQEKDKKQTIDRLLQKQGTKSKKGKSARKARVPAFSYLNNRRAITISIPQGFNFPCPPQKSGQSPSKTMCGISGCLKAKKYSCSKTGIPLCSLICYKKNLASRGLV